MRNKNLDQICIFILISILAASAVFAVFPSAPTAIEVVQNMTNDYPNGTQQNGTRGYIYELNITESQPTMKWVGYVGHVYGEFALQDANGYALYDWELVTTTGELYATKEGYDAAGPNELTNPYAGGIPIWANLSCANSSMISEENTNFNHTASDEDSLYNTFTTTGFSNPGFYVGDNPIQDNDSISSPAESECYGTYLNYNNTESDPPHADGNWTQVVLTDGTFQAAGEGGDGAEKDYDIVYASLMRNESWGFDFNTYDFQIILPQSALPGSQPPVAFYFYIELV